MAVMQDTQQGKTSAAAEPIITERLNKPNAFVGAGGKAHDNSHDQPQTKPANQPEGPTLQHRWKIPGQSRGIHDRHISGLTID